MISIIVPIYNAENEIGRCLETLIHQTYRDIEIILVDDGSIDNSYKICQQYADKDNRILLLKKDNGGASSARNLGLEYAKGEYIGFVDSDDWIELDMYEYLLRVLEENNSDVSIIQSKSMNEVVKTENKFNENIVIVNQNEMIEKFFRIHSDELQVSAVMRLYKKSILDKIRFIENRITEDIYFSFKVFKECKNIAISNQIKYYWFLKEGSVTHSAYREKDRDYFYIWDRIIEEVEIEYPEYIQYAKRNRCRGYFTLLCKMLLYGVDKTYTNYEEDRKEYVKQIREHYFEIIKFNMGVKRKIGLTMLCINFKFVELGCRIYKKILYKNL